jgi:hypothetical protein
MDLTIVNPYFAHNADYQGGKPILLYLNGFDENADPVEMFMSVGADWITADGGKTITHPTKTKVNRNSIYGHWLQAALEIPELRDMLFDRGAPTSADVWLNLILHLELREIKFGKNLDPIERLMPVSYLGVYEDSKVSSPNPLTTTQPPLTVVTTEATAPSASTTGSPLRVQMVELARSSANFPAFLSAALGNPEVLADDDLAQAVADQTIIWAEAH